MPQPPPPPPSPNRVNDGFDTKSYPPPLQNIEAEIDDDSFPTTPLTRDKEEDSYRKVKSNSQANSVRIKRLRSDLDEGVENPSARTRFNRYMSEEDSKVLSEKLHEIRNIINKELGRPKDLSFF